METTLSISEISLWNCAIVAFGWILMYFILPETENRTQEDIELHFTDKSKKVTDRKIARLNSTQKNQMSFDDDPWQMLNLESLNEIENNEPKIVSKPVYCDKNRDRSFVNDI